MPLKRSLPTWKSPYWLSHTHLKRAQSPLPLEDVYNGYTDDEPLFYTLAKGTALMNEPTQDLIVSELRRRVRASLADVTQVLGLQFASLIPQEIQRMNASGLVVYDEPLGPSSLLSLPR